MKKILIIILILLPFMIHDVNASELRLVNEINDIQLISNNNVLQIQGWAFISDAQNFRDMTTHQYSLQFKSKNDSFIIVGSQRLISHTDTMFYVGSRYCGDHEFMKDSTICNNYYENIGFNFNVPLHKFKMNETYDVKLTVQAFDSKISKTTELYFPNKEAIVLKNKHNQYTVDTKLHDTGAKILYDHVLVRKTPNKGSGAIKQNLKCSTDDNAYYKVGTIFSKIYDKQFFNNTTYYQLKGKLSGCEKQKGRVVEGNDYSPIWVASTFIDHVGEPLTIVTKEVNNDPIITVSEHPVLYTDEKLDIWSGVSAYDEEDGDLSDKIKIESNSYQNIPGSYSINYSVTDSFGSKVEAVKNVTVLRRNYPPQIEANDISIRRYSPFNPYLYAKAYDQDKKDISYAIKTMNLIDITKVAKQELCYEVTDSYNMSNTKCIMVDVVDLSSSFRFIQQRRLFYKEEIPIIWKDKMTDFYEELDNEIIYHSLSFSK